MYCGLLFGTQYHAGINIQLFLNPSCYLQSRVGFSVQIFTHPGGTYLKHFSQSSLGDIHLLHPCFYYITKRQFAYRVSCKTLNCTTKKHPKNIGTLNFTTDMKSHASDPYKTSTLNPQIQVTCIVGSFVLLFLF
jgi:hypothetical protein